MRQFSVIVREKGTDTKMKYTKSPVEAANSTEAWELVAERLDEGQVVDEVIPLRRQERE